ncbi:MAG: hypothetical protein ACI92O_000452 [Colwellia sp.]|jgi:hypothetical protein
MFTYPYGIIESDIFTRDELIALKPFMRSQCIRSEQEFEAVFAQTITHLFNKSAMQSKIIFSDRTLPTEVLNQFPTSWLAQRKNYRMHEILFYQEKIFHYLKALSVRDPLTGSYDLATEDEPPLPFGISLGIGPDYFRISSSGNKSLFIDCPISKTTPLDIVKLKRYLNRLIKVTYANNVCLVAPVESAPNTPLKLALPITLKNNGLPTSGYLLCDGKFVQAYSFNRLPMALRFVKTPAVESFVQNIITSEQSKKIAYEVTSARKTLDELFTFRPLKPLLKESPLVHVQSNKYHITGIGLNFIIKQRTLMKLKKILPKKDMETFLIETLQSKNNYLAAG